MFWTKRKIEKKFQQNKNELEQFKFANEVGGGVTDDHIPVNEAGIPTVDIIPFYPDCRQSSFGPTWHTINDDMEHLDINTLKAVGQTLIQVIYSE